jgi:tetratricopeptide (TPR) repeat protein
MPTRITINCPACSATLAAPASAAGRTLLCPQCRTAIPVPELPVSGDSELPTSGREIDRSQKHHSNDRPLDQDACSLRRGASRRRATFLSVTLILGLFTGMYRFQEWKKSKTIETAFQAKDFDQVLTLDPNHAEALMGRIYRRLELPDTNVEGAVSDLEQLQEILPQHAIHKEILPAISIARSMEYAAAGRIAAAIEELGFATESGSPVQHLDQVKQRLTTLLLKQIEVSLAEQRYDQAISECNQIRKLVGDNLSAMAFERSALCGLADRAVTDDEMNSTIRRLVELDKGHHLAETSGKLRSLYSRRSRLNYSNGNLAGAIDDYAKLLTYGGVDVETMRWGVTLSEATIVALEDDFSKLHLQRALLLIDLLEKNFVNAASVVRAKISLADNIFTASTTQNRDEALDYAALTLIHAQTIGFIVEIIDGKADFRKRISAALIERGVSRIRTDMIEQAGSDLEVALKISPETQDQLLARLDQLPAEFREQLPVSLRGEEANVPVDSILDLFPSNAEAFSVVRNMQSFSKDVDQVAASMLLGPPSLLDAACKESRIKEGLNRGGSLGWVQMPVTGKPVDNEGMIFFIPASNFASMIREIKAGKQSKGQPLIPVEMNGYSGLAVQIKSHGAFAFERDKNHLFTTIRGPNGVQNHMIPFERWDQDLDAYFLVTREGLQSGLRSISIPFSNHFLELLFQQVAISTFSVDEFSGLTRAEIQNQLQQVAVGLSIHPEMGIAVRSRTWLSPGSDLQKVFSKNPGGREVALSRLPDEKCLIAFGGPISAVQSDWITALPGLLSPEAGEIDVLISGVQAAILAPEPEFASENDDGNPVEQHHSDSPYVQLLNRTILVVTVDDSQTALAELKSLFEAAPMTLSVETGESDEIPVLRIGQRFSLSGAENHLELRIATPNRESLVFAYGGEKQLKRALEPFRDQTNLSQTQTIKAAVRMLPQSTSWIIAIDLRVLGHWLRALKHQLPYYEFFSSILIQEDELALPFAVGLSWQKSDFDVHLSIPVETLPLAGRLAPFFNLVP